jgi:hypothetical protein
MLYVILYFKLRNIVISQFGIRNIVLVIFKKKIKTRLNSYFTNNKMLSKIAKKTFQFFNVINHFLINAKSRSLPDDLNALKKQRV